MKNIFVMLFGLDKENPLHYDHWKYVEEESQGLYDSDDDHQPVERIEKPEPVTGYSSAHPYWLCKLLGIGTYPAVLEDLEEDEKHQQNAKLTLSSKP